MVDLRTDVLISQYPGENDYNAYLTKFGGMSNAFTASTSTNYYSAQCYLR